MSDFAYHHRDLQSENATRRPCLPSRAQQLQSMMMSPALLLLLLLQMQMMKMTICSCRVRFESLRHPHLMANNNCPIVSLHLCYLPVPEIRLPIASPSHPPYA